MTKYKNSYQMVRERLEQEGKITVLTPEQNFDLITSLNKKMSEGELEIKVKGIEAEMELASIVLTA